MQAFIDRFRYNANRAALVQSRIKALERLAGGCGGMGVGLQLRAVGEWWVQGWCSRASRPLPSWQGVPREGAVGSWVDAIWGRQGAGVPGGVQVQSSIQALEHWSGGQVVDNAIMDRILLFIDLQRWRRWRKTRRTSSASPRRRTSVSGAPGVVYRFRGTLNKKIKM